VSLPMPEVMVRKLLFTLLAIWLRVVNFAEMVEKGTRFGRGSGG